MTTTPQIPQHVLDHAPWSISKANTAIQCPHAFDLQYRKKTKKVESAPENQTVGNVVHKICELALQGAPLDRVFSQVSDSYDLTHNLREEVLTFRDAVEDFLRRMDSFKAQFKVTKVVAEKKLAINPDFTQSPYFNKKGLFRGIIDVTLVTNDNHCVVIDHKSGVKKPLSTHQEQLEGYGVIILANYPTIKSVLAGLNFLGGEPQANGKRIVWAHTYERDHITTRLRQNLVKHLTRAADSAKTDEPKKGWMCNYCGYRPLCPLHT
jgi:ATP-dependent exoDNAse (exonuclease V) beta subunit